jgi:hypothetical protein
MGGRWLLCPIRSARQRPFIPAVRDALRLTDHDNATRMGSMTECQKVETMFSGGCDCCRRQ